MTGNCSAPAEERFAEAIRQFDSANAADPHTEIVNDQPQPRELVYAARLTEWVRRLAPAASEPLLLAARCQHICRWKIARNSYPMDRAGYLRWRSDLKKFHAKMSAEILRAVGYDAEVIQRVGELNQKLHLATDPETQTLEDALCLVFLQYQLAAFAAKTDRAKVIAALQKSWAKMSAAARTEALKLPYSEMEQELVTCALNSGRTSPNR